MAAITMSATILKHSQEAFVESVLPFLDSLDNKGVDHCSKAVAKKIAGLHAVHSALDSEKAKPLPNAIAIHKLAKEVSSIETLIKKEQMDLLLDCYSLYAHAFEAPLPFIIGGPSLRDASSLAELKNFGVLSSGEPALSHHLTGQISNLVTGSVFCPKPWSLLRNDCFMLGAIDSNHTFYLAGKVDDLVFFDEKEGHLKVLGRELAMLAVSGYQQVASDELAEKCGYTFVCVEPDKKPSSLPELISKILKFKEPADITCFLSKND